MKKLFIFSIALVLSALMQAYASQGVGFFLNGVELKVSGTYTNTDGVGITKGKAVYDHATKTLTLVNAFIESDIHDVLYIWGDEPCKLILEGFNSFYARSANKACISLDYAAKGNDQLHLTITKGTSDTGILALTSKNIGIYAETEGRANTSITIDNVTVNNYSTNYGITAKSGQILKLHTLAGTKFYTQEQTYAAIERTNWVTKTTNIVYPATGATYDSSKGGVVDASGAFHKGHLLIGSKITSLSYDPDIYLIVGDTIDATPSRTPANTWYQFTWTSNNSSVATVLSTGDIIAKGAGTTQIVAMTQDGSGKFATFNVSVSADLYVGNTKVTSANLSNIPGLASGKASYDIKTKTLTLNNAKITNSYNITGSDRLEAYGIYSEGDLIVNLVNDNVIDYENSGYASFSSCRGYGIFTVGKITLNENGKLTIKSIFSDAKELSSNYTGIYGMKGVEINKATIINEEHQRYKKDALFTNGEPLVISNNATLISDGGVISGFKTQPTTYAGAVIEEGDTKSTVKKVSALTIYGTHNGMYKSKPYIRISPNGTGLATLTAQGIQVRGGKGEIHINLPPNPLKGELSERTVNVYGLSGALVHSVKTWRATSLQIPMQPGIYIVRIGNAAEKIVVR